MSKFCGKCGSKLNENGLCPKCDGIPKKKKKTVVKMMIIILISVILIITICLLTYYKIVDIPFVSSVLNSMGIGNSGDESGITYQEFSDEDIAFDNGELYVKSQLLITADENYTYNDVKKAVKNYGGKIVGVVQFTNDYQIEFENKSYDELNDIAEKLKDDLSDSDVGLHKAFYVNEEKTSDSNEADGDWWRDAIWLTKLENDNNTYSNVNVGIFDDKFDTANKDLEGLFTKEWQNPKTVTETKHGTMVAGLIAAKKNNNYGIDGVSSNSTLYGFSYNGNNLNEYASSEMKYKYAMALMLSEGVKIINFSNGYDEMMAGAQLGVTSAENDLKEFSEALSKFLSKYIDNGYDFIITKAAGNLNNKTWIKCDVSSSHPYGIKAYNSNEDGKLNSNNKFDDTVFTAEYDIFGAITDAKVKNRIIMVGSVTKNGNGYAPNIDSVRGNRVDVYSPGSNLSCLIPSGNENHTEIASGTSFATPIVAGVVSLVWGINPDLSSEQVKKVITEKTLYNIEGESKKLINAFYAVRYSQNLRNQGSSNKNSTGTVMGLIRAESEDNEAYISGAKIEFTKSGDTAVTETVITDQYGTFDVALDSGSYTMTVSHDGYKDFSKTIDLQADDVVYLDDIFLLKESKVSEWKQAYIDRITEVGNSTDFVRSDSEYYLAYINNDDIPELIIDYNMGAMGSEVCTFSGNNLSTIQYGQSGVAYLERQNLIWITGGHMGVYFDYVYSIENGDFVLLDEGDYNEVIDDENIYYEYNWNGVEMNQSDYSSSLRAVFDIDSAVKAYEDSDSYSYYEIIDVINSYY